MPLFPKKSDSITLITLITLFENSENSITLKSYFWSLNTYFCAKFLFSVKLMIQRNIFKQENEVPTLKTAKIQFYLVFAVS